MRNQSTFPRELVHLNPCAVELLDRGIQMGAGRIRAENGFWPSFAYVEITDLLSGENAMVTFLLVSCGSVIYYESLFKVRFPQVTGFVIIPVDFDRGPLCSRLKNLEPD